MNKKIVIYQVFTRLYGNRNTNRAKWGSIEENGSGKFDDFDTPTLRKIRVMGFSHIWFTGVIRHATQTDYSQYGIPRQHPLVVKGKAGSPYAIADYYDVDPDLANDVEKRMTEFDALVRRVHRAGMKMIIDFVPNHVARQYHSVAKPDGVDDLGASDDPQLGFSSRNNFYYCPGCRFEPNIPSGKCSEKEPYEEYPAKATGNDCFNNHPGSNDWYETVKLNYGVDYWTGIGHFNPIPDTWQKMADILLFWASKGVDGFRCDMAEMVPADFWEWATRQVKAQYPDIIFVGEVYDPSKYRRYIEAGFDYLYDKVGMYDTVRGVICGYTSAHNITYAWQSTDDISSHMLYFLENHDEQRIASDFFAADARKALPGLVASALMRGNPFMLYAGEEYGERGMDDEGFSGRDGRTTIFDYWNIPTLTRAALGQLTDEERSIYEYHQKVLSIARKEKAIDGDFYDVMYVNPTSADFDASRQYAFLRKGGNEMMLIVCNFAENDVNVKARIPKHAVDMLNIPGRKYRATDLLTGDKLNISIKGDSVVAMNVPGYGARVWKFATRTVKMQ